MTMPDYADPRSHQYFECYYVGNQQGDNGTDRRTSWNSRSDARPTSTFRIGPGGLFCVYCGNAAKVIQDERFEVTGYACCCKGAMDELEWVDDYEQLLARHAQELSELKQKLPQTSDRVIRERLAAVSPGMVKDIVQHVNQGAPQDEGFSLGSLDIQILSPVRERIAQA